MTRWQLIRWSFVFILLAGAIGLRAQDTTGVNFTPMETAPAATAAPAKVHHAEPKPSPTMQIGGAIARAPQSLWVIFWAGIAGGFAALLMPCIFPMLPMTVSFFTKGATVSGEGPTVTGDGPTVTHGKGVSRAVLYGLSIIVIYVTLGLLVTALFGADALNNLATNGLFNFSFFLLLVVFAASFLGGFEITLPASWTNKMDARAGSRNIIGIFFMAATLALVSFSCTGPIIGTLLAQTATTGAVLAPATGMFGFSLALALPFTLFALFPGWLGRLPKSGGWLNSVKVVLGFLELAFSLKFLSNVDLTYHWHLFDREVFLVLWIIIFGMTGFYLLGKIRLSHDSPLPFIPIPRLFLAIITLAFTIYMIPGLWGAPLRSVSAFLPPLATQDFDLSGTTATADAAVTSNTAGSGHGPHKYATLFDKPRGFDPFFDYAEGLAFAKQQHKPLMIDFTGHACVNCRKMEADVWTDPPVRQRINGDFVLVQLYVDDKTELDSAEQMMTPDRRILKTIGGKWSELQTAKFGANSQPYYVLLDPATEQPLVAPQGANFDATEYLGYLDSGLAAFKTR